MAATRISLSGVGEPRLRFDRTAVGFVKRLQDALSESCPKGKTLVLTCTAPIRQDSKTGKLLEARIAKMIASRKMRLDTTILGNRIRVRVLKGAAAVRLVGFVHNPEPNPEALFNITRALLRAMDSARRDRVLIVRNKSGPVPIKALQAICAALRAQTVFRRILVSEGG
jgi:hypothetical protein